VSDINRTVLSGGVRVVTEAMAGSRSATVGIWVGVGSRDETPSLAGTSHFLEHLLFKGTENRTGLDIARTMDAVGGEFNAFTTKEATCYHASVLDEDCALAIDLVADVVLNATIAAADVAIERTVVLEEIAMRDDDPSDLVHDVATTSLLGDTPLGRSILGTVESIESLTRTQIAGYYQRRYDPAGMVVSVAGNVDHRAVVREVRKAFAGRIDKGAKSAAIRHGAVPARRPVQTPVVVADDTEQANIVLNTVGLPARDDRLFALGVLSNALGGGMSSRLFQEVREKRGLAYSVYSYSASYAGAGEFGLYAGCTPGKAHEVLAIMRDQVSDILANGLHTDEVDRGKAQSRGGVVLGSEDSTSRMTRLGKSELVYGELRPMEDVLRRIAAVTVDDVNDLAAELLGGSWTLTVVGPFGDNDFS
jgi:predicted Zn-dependent peptidase